MAISKKQTPKKASWKRTFFVTFLLALSVRSFAFQAFHIPSGSMKNTLLVGDYLFVNELAYGLHSPKYIPLTNIPIPHFALNYNDVSRGDVVVFEYPGDRDVVAAKDRNINYIKRCAGLPGDEIEIRAKQLYVNGKPFENPSELRFNYSAMHKDHPDDRTFPKK